MAGGSILGFAGTGATIEQGGQMLHRISIRRDTEINGRHIWAAPPQLRLGVMGSSSTVRRRGTRIPL